MLELLTDPGLLQREVAEMMAAGGFVMPPLALATLVLWYTLGVRAVTLVRGDRRDLRALLAAEQSDARAGVDRQPRGVIGVAAWHAARVAPRRRDAAGRKALRSHLDQVFGGLESDMARGRKLVHAIVTVAPLLGLLGTVTGMVETFDSLAEMALFSQGGGVAGGVAQALLTTQVGLVVAIPGIFADRLLARKQFRLQAELDELKELVVHTSAVIGPSSPLSTPPGPAPVLSGAR